MSAKRFLPLLLSAGLVLAVGCDLGGLPTTVASTKPGKGDKADKKKGSPSPSPSPSASASASASTKPSGSPSAAPGVPATDAEVAAATAFPFTEAGMRWHYKLAIKAGAINLPGTLVIECQAVTQDGADVRSTFEIDMSKAPLPGASTGGPKTIDKVQQIKKGTGNPYTQIVGALFEAQATGTTPASATPAPSPPVPTNTKETITVVGKSYDVVRQKFKSSLSGTEVEFDLFMTAAEGMVKEGVKSKKLPASLLPPQAMMLASLGLDMTLELEKKEKGVPSTPLPSGSPSTNPNASASPSGSPSASASPSGSPSPSPSASASAAS